MGGRGKQITEFQASLVYRLRSRTARATQRYPVSKKTKKKKRINKKTEGERERERKREESLKF